MSSNKKNLFLSPPISLSLSQVRTELEDELGIFPKGVSVRDSREIVKARGSQKRADDLGKIG